MERGACKAVLTKDHNESLVFLQDPLCVEIITNPISETKIARGMGFIKWQQLSDEDFYVIREERYIICFYYEQTNKLLYEAFVMAEGAPTSVRISKRVTTILNQIVSGFIGDIDDYRTLFEKYIS